ncbi:MAG: pyridoxamine 5'-phosphate oxidase [Betaproteobacteria bacterium]|jgi:pyridoxamine 5'-phosphate oxidase
MRKSYTLAQLDEEHSQSSPLEQFQLWFDDALKAHVPEPTAMTLATVDQHMKPSTRIVLLKGLDARGLVWYTNYQSRKGLELAGNPFAALQFHWVELERVVRIEGLVEKISEQESDTYFQSRPLDSRIGAWASPQSEVLQVRDELERAFSKVKLQYGEAPPRPPHWGGYRLIPSEWEFWQGRPSRLHDRLRYQKSSSTQSSNWLRDRLAP